MAVLGLALGTPVALADDLVFGSFADEEVARRFASGVGERLGLDTRVVVVDVGGVLYSRVAARFGSEREARAALVEAHAAGFVDAWYLPGEDVPAAPGGGDPGEAVATRREVSARPSGDWRLTFVVPGETPETIVVPRREAVVRMDGRLDEPFWAALPGYDNMVLVEPGTLASTRHETIARYFHSDAGLHIGVWNEQPPDTLRRRSSRSGQARGDAWGITLDTSGRGRYGHWFSVGLGDAAGDAPKGWESATAELGDGWSLEVFVPWSMLALPPAQDVRSMGIYVNRTVAYIGERWGWPARVVPARDAPKR